MVYQGDRYVLYIIDDMAESASCQFEVFGPKNEQSLNTSHTRDFVNEQSSEPVRLVPQKRKEKFLLSISLFRAI